MDSIYLCLFVSLQLLSTASAAAPLVLPASVLVFTAPDNIHAMNITGGQSVAFPSISPQLTRFQGIAYNWRTSTFVITEVGPKTQAESKYLVRLNLVAKSARASQVPGHSYPTAIAIDVISNTFYYTDATEGEVSVVATNEGHERILMTSLTDAHGLALDPVEGLLFVSLSPPNQAQRGRILRAQMDGTQRRTIVSANVKWPLALTIDQEAKWLYWTDTLLSTIEKCRYDGTMRQTIANLNGLHPLTLTLDETFIYFAISLSGKIHRVPKASNETIAYEILGPTNPTSVNAIFDVVAITPAMQILGTNQCRQANGNCAQICLPIPSGRTCACSTKYTLAPNGRDCLQSNFQKILLATDYERHGIFVIDTESGGYVRMSLFNINNPTGITWDAKSKTFFWASMAYSRIGRSCVYPQACVSKIADWRGMSFTGLAVDPFSEHIYIADGVNRLIFRITYDNDGTRTTIVKLDIASPQSLALDLTRRWIFWTEILPVGKIRRRSMDMDSDITTLIDTDILVPNAVVVDPQLELMFWCDGRKKTIEVSSLDGENRRVLYQGNVTLLSLTLDDHYIYFSDTSSTALHRIDRMTGNNLRVIGPSIFHKLYDIVYVDISLTPQAPSLRPPTALTTTPYVAVSATTSTNMEFANVSTNGSALRLIVIITVACVVIIIIAVISITIACVVIRRKSRPGPQPVLPDIITKDETHPMKMRPKIPLPEIQEPPTSPKVGYNSVSDRSHYMDMSSVSQTNDAFE